jgi:hypothetical protein
MHRRRRRHSAIGVAALVASLVGCGSDGAMTAADYRAGFETLCLEIEADIVDLGDRFRDVDQGSDEQLELAREQAAVTKKFTDGIADLRPPAELNGDHQQLLAHIADVDAASAAADFEAIAAASTAAEEVIAEMGITGCS